MDFDALVDSMRAFPAELEASIAAASSARLRFRPTESAWSMNGVLHHLLDEERLDFRVRLRATLEDPTTPWEPIDPEGWATARGYEDGDPGLALASFLEERRATLAWLDGLRDAPWTHAHHHPELGPIRADELFCAWALHDRLHLAQIVRRTVEHARALAGDVSCRYALP